ncbi:hypothetical protein G9A89_005260 [Geosiphon pyriformis]|nr:hypothetical protein G9A89_005260 [Geosiphon pyriformis]
MNLKAVSGGDMSKKKTPKEAFYGSVGGSGNSVYSDVDSLFCDNKDIGMAGINGEFLLGSAATTLKAKHINTGAAFGFPLGSPNFDMDNNEEVFLPSHLSISLDKKQSFALDINFLVVEEKLVTAKTQIIRKIFSTVNEKSMKMATLLAREKGININSNLKRQEMRSDWAVVIKKIPMDTSKNMIIATWLFLIGKDSVCIVKAVGDCETWVLRDQFRVLLFTLLMEIMAHDLRTLLGRAGEKTYFINRFLKTGNRICCAVVGFEFDDDLESCKKCEKFGHSALECNASVASPFKSSKTFKKVASNERHLQLAKLYEKKSVPISCPAAFGVVLLVDSSDGFHFASGSSSSLSGTSGLNDGLPPVLVGNLSLNICLASLEQSLELLTNQVSGIVHKLSSMELVPLVSPLSSGHLVAPIVVNADSDSNMVLDSSVVVPATPPIVSALGFSSSKILTTKVGCLKSKLVALKALIGFVLVKVFGFFPLPMSGLVWKFAVCNVCSINVPAKQMDIFEDVYVFTSGLNKSFLSAKIAVIINNSLTHYVSKVKKILGKIILVRFLFKGKLSVTILGLYASASSETRFGQALKVNFLIAKAVNSSTFVVLGGDFNENESRRSATFKFCLGLDLVNSFANHHMEKAFTWSNSQRVEKTIDFIFVCSVSGFFDTDHSDVSTGFRDCLSIKLLVVADEFFGAETYNDMDFFGLELLIAKIVKKFVLGDLPGVDCLVKTWSTLNSAKTCAFADLIGLGGKSEVVLGHLSLVHKEYRRLKMYESRVAKKAFIKLVISKHMENFCSDKDSMIRSVLDQPSCKVVLNYLVVDNELILELEKAVFLVVPDLWAHQYALLDYVQDCAFSNVMSVISLNKLLLVVDGLPDSKAAGFGDGVLEYLLRLLNACLLVGGVSVLVLMNTWPIALIKTARKILSKILFDRISSACSKFGVLQSNNFSVLKGTSTQSPVFMVGLVVEDALEKDWKLWLVLQDMHKTYDSVDWHYLETSLH